MTPAEREQVVDAAYAELVARFGPVPRGSNACHAWHVKYRAEFRAVMTRMLAGEPAPPVQEAIEWK